MAVDIYRTLAALAGRKRPAGLQPIDGPDLTPALHDSAARVRGHAYHAYPRPGRLGQAIRTERQCLVRQALEKTGARDYELYDFVDDLLETRNPAVERPEVRVKLEAILERQPAPKSVKRRASLRHRSRVNGGFRLLS